MSSTNPVILEVKDLKKSFGDHVVLKSINTTISKGEVIAIIGPSGCGKTTTLRIIGGFVEADEGDIFFDGKKINGLPPHKRHVNTVFQRYALFPHLNVYENIEFGLKISKVPEEE